MITVQLHVLFSTCIESVEERLLSVGVLYALTCNTRLTHNLRLGNDKDRKHVHVEVRCFSTLCT